MCVFFLAVPHMILGKEGFTMIDQSDSKDAQAGTFVLLSLEFSTHTSLEAWELYAEYPGRIQLQVRELSAAVYEHFFL